MRVVLVDVCLVVLVFGAIADHLQYTYFVTQNEGCSPANWECLEKTDTVSAIDGVETAIRCCAIDGSTCVSTDLEGICLGDTVTFHETESIRLSLGQILCKWSQMGSICH